MIIFIISSVILVLALFLIHISETFLYFQGILHPKVANKLRYESLNQEIFLYRNHLGMTFCLGYACSIFPKIITSV